MIGTGTGPGMAPATARETAAGLDAVVVGPLAVDYTINGGPADVHGLLADLVAGATRLVAPARLVVDRATIMRVPAALRSRLLSAEPGGRALRVARRLASDNGRRVGLVGVGVQTLSADLAIHAELARHGIDHRHVSADDDLAGITVTVASHAGLSLVYGGPNRRLAAVLRRDQPAVAAYLAGARLVHAVLPDDPTVVSALAQVLAVARRTNPGLRVSVDASACPDHHGEQFTALVAMVDVLIVAADAGLHHLLEQAPPRIDPGAVVAELRAARPDMTVLDIAADQVNVRSPDGVVASLTPCTAAALPLDGDQVASALTAAVLTAVDQGDEVVAAVEAAISHATAHRRPPPEPAETAVAPSQPAVRRSTVARVLFGHAGRALAAALVVALPGWPVAVAGLVTGWPVLLCAALPTPYMVLRLAPMVLQRRIRTRPAAVNGHGNSAPLDTNPTGLESSGP